MEQEELLDGYETEQDNSLSESKFEEYKNIMMLSGDGRTGTALITGTNGFKHPFPTRLISDFANIKYIPNANYFLINPQHALNDGSDNAGGTCTTVALQMLLGYHNYYSDRRIIPAVSADGTRFLDANYGNLAYHPVFQRPYVLHTPTKRGCEYIGTQNAVYEDLFNRTWISDWYGIGQAIPLVVDGVNRFMNVHTPTAVKNNISLTWGIFSASTAKADIDAGNPIVLGMQPIFTGSDAFHVVPAYGYAKLDGVDGFLVHYGWGSGAIQVWVPASWFGFQVRMSVNHTHSYSNTSGELRCTVCNYRTPQKLEFNSNGGTAYSPIFAKAGDLITLPITPKINRCGDWEAGGTKYRFGQTITFNPQNFANQSTIQFNAQLHSSTFTSNDVHSHTKKCTTCNTSVVQGHNWSEFPTFFKCIDCGFTSKFIPIIKYSLPISFVQSNMLNAVDKLDIASNVPVFLFSEDTNKYYFYDGQYYIVKDGFESEFLDFCRNEHLATD